MSFNPYSVRPIGSEQFEEHLQDCYVSAFYHYQLPVSHEDPKKLAVYGEKMWHSADAYDPWLELVFAITAQAVIDYIKAWRSWQKAKADFNIGYETLWHSQMLRIENEYFRKYDAVEPVFEKLLDILQKADYTETRLISKVMHNYNQWCSKHDFQKGTITK